MRKQERSSTAQRTRAMCPKDLHQFRMRSWFASTARMQREREYSEARWEEGGGASCPLLCRTVQVMQNDAHNPHLLRRAELAEKRREEGLAEGAPALRILHMIRFVELVEPLRGKATVRGCLQEPALKNIRPRGPPVPALTSLTFLRVHEENFSTRSPPAPVVHCSSGARCTEGASEAAAVTPHPTTHHKHPQ